MFNAELTLTQIASILYLLLAAETLLVIVALRLVLGPKRWDSGDIATCAILSLLWPATWAVTLWDAIQLAASNARKGR